MNNLSRDDVDEILRLIDNSGYVEMRLELDDIKIHVRKQNDGFVPNGSGEAQSKSDPPAQAERPASESTETQVKKPSPSPSPAAAADAVPEGMVAVRAPMLGSFYRSPTPDEPPFVEVGDRVEPGQDVGLIEVMKLFNSVKSDYAGKVVEIRAENGGMVEYDEPLMLIQAEQQ
jgi:acetyl-CoA carboxylase biotin carboxyl carrier protein